MLFYSKIIESEGIDTTERDVVCTNVESPKLCYICHFYFFKNRNFNYQPHVCDECHGAALRAQISKLLRLKRKPLELLAIFHTTKLFVCLKQVT